LHTSQEILVPITAMFCPLDLYMIQNFDQFVGISFLIKTEKLALNYGFDLYMDQLIRKYVL
jgi:hypothetical protein